MKLPNTEQGIHRRDFVSGDELPCGSKLRTLELPARCSSGCGGRRHAVKLYLDQENLQRWTRAGQMIRRILLASGSSRPEQPSSSSPEEDFIPNSPNVVEHNRNEDVEDPAIGSADRASRKAQDAIKRTADTVMAWPHRLPEIGTLLSIHRPSKLCFRASRPLCRVEESNEDCAEDEAAIPYDLRWADASNDNCTEDEVAMRTKEGKELISSRASNLQDKGLQAVLCVASMSRSFGYDDGQGSSLALVIGLTSAYGGIHMVAWNCVFPSVLEHWIWRISCIALVLFAWPVMLYTCVDSLLRRLATRRGWGISGQLSESAELFLMPFWTFFSGFSMLIISYTACARIFIVVESFISLRSVPIGVYATVPWANYIPHI
jgi:hypothetical protein